MLTQTLINLCELSSDDWKEGRCIGRCHRFCWTWSSAPAAAGAGDSQHWNSCCCQMSIGLHRGSVVALWPHSNMLCQNELFQVLFFFSPPTLSFDNRKVYMSEILLFLFCCLRVEFNSLMQLWLLWGQRLVVGSGYLNQFINLFYNPYIWIYC